MSVWLRQANMWMFPTLHMSTMCPRPRPHPMAKSKGQWAKGMSALIGYHTDLTLQLEYGLLDIASDKADEDDLDWGEQLPWVSYVYVGLSHREMLTSLPLPLQQECFGRMEINVPFSHLNLQSVRTSLSVLTLPMVNDLCCLACSAKFGSRKQLSAHTSQCALSFSLTDQIFNWKQKSDKKKKRKDKRAHRGESPNRLPDDAVIPEQPDI
ncbi:hypothetical protein BDR03DRAFT_1019166 [Suillus americanus]|nr:hypothetical protein BDR03DRAFT_1019166 [Suillus americanus]